MKRYKMDIITIKLFIKSVGENLTNLYIWIQLFHFIAILGKHLMVQLDNKS